MSIPGLEACLEAAVRFDRDGLVGWPLQATGTNDWVGNKEGSGRGALVPVLNYCLYWAIVECWIWFSLLLVIVIIIFLLFLLASLSASDVPKSASNAFVYPAEMKHIHG